MRGAFFCYNQENDRWRKHTPKEKSVVEGEGVGTVTPQMIEEQAREIPRSDGRAQPNDLDRGGAHEQLIGATSGLQKSPPREEPGRDWQMPLVSTGEKAPKVRPEDDENIPEKLALAKGLRKPTTISV